ncbi:MAG TPA: hypothetical protein VGA18_04430 [Rhodothermales bacterium]
MDREEFWDTVKTWTPSALVAVAGLYFVLTRKDYSLLDAADLFVHELGHLVFAFMGEPLRMAGGTLLQIIVPILLVVGFLKGDYRLGVQFSLFWLGQNFLNISVYAQDARRQMLPLVGGRHARHDWNWMLGQLGILEWDQGIGFFFIALAVAAFAAAVIAPKYLH